MGINIIPIPYQRSNNVKKGRGEVWSGDRHRRKSRAVATLPLPPLANSRRLNVEIFIWGIWYMVSCKGRMERI